MVGAVGGIGGMDHSQMMQKRFERLDVDGDGGLNQEEFGAISKKTGKSLDQISEMFSVADTNEDGLLTKNEMKGAMEGIRGKRSLMPLKGGNGQFINKLTSAINSGDDDMITSLIDLFKSNAGYGIGNTSNLASMLFDTEA